MPLKRSHSDLLSSKMIEQALRSMKMIQLFVLKQFYLIMRTKCKESNEKSAYLDVLNELSYERHVMLVYKFDTPKSGTAFARDLSAKFIIYNSNNQTPRVCVQQLFQPLILVAIYFGCGHFSWHYIAIAVFLFLFLLFFELISICRNGLFF